MLAVKFGFFIALAFHFTFIDEEGSAAQRTNVDAHVKIILRNQFESVHRHLEDLQSL